MSLEKSLSQQFSSILQCVDARNNYTGLDLLQSDMMQTEKSNTPSDIHIGKYNEIRSLYPQHIPILTDGSKLSNYTATAVVFKSHIIIKRLPNLVSIYTAELYAIHLALNELSKQQHEHYRLFSDSLSSLNSISNKKLDHPITLQILLKYHNLFTHSYNCLLYTSPSPRDGLLSRMPSSA